MARRAGLIRYPGSLPDTLYHSDYLRRHRQHRTSSTQGRLLRFDYLEDRHLRHLQVFGAPCG
jgi:hypothetical protein